MTKSSELYQAFMRNFASAIWFCGRCQGAVGAQGRSDDYARQPGEARQEGWAYSVNVRWYGRLGRVHQAPAHLLPDARGGAGRQGAGAPAAATADARLLLRQGRGARRAVGRGDLDHHLAAARRRDARHLRRGAADRAGLGLVRPTALPSPLCCPCILSFVASLPPEWTRLQASDDGVRRRPQ